MHGALHVHMKRSSARSVPPVDGHWQGKLASPTHSGGGHKPAVRNEKRSIAVMDYSMGYSTPVDRTAAAAAALAELRVRPAERVLIMLPDGPGFAEAFAGTIKQGRCHCR